jgi:hypothetical protein
MQPQSRSDSPHSLLGMTLAEMPPELLRPQPRRKTRRRARFMRFIVCEFVAVAALMTCAALSTSERFLRPEYNRVFTTLMVVCAALVVLIPVLFYGMPGRLPRHSR